MKISAKKYSLESKHSPSYYTLNNIKHLNCDIKSLVELINSSKGVVMEQT